MALTSPPFFDTSVLIPGILVLGPGGEPAQQIFDAIAGGRIARPGTAWHCCLEFYAVTTRLPEGRRITPAESARLIEEELLGRFQVHGLPDRERTAFFRTAGGDQIAGGRVYDAHIAEIARQSGATTVVTENRRHFLTLMRHGIRVLTAAEFAAGIRR